MLYKNIVRPKSLKTNLNKKSGSIKGLYKLNLASEMALNIRTLNTV